MGKETEIQEKAIERAAEREGKRIGVLAKTIIVTLFGGGAAGAALFGGFNIFGPKQPNTSEMKEAIKEVVREVAPDPKDITAIKESILRMEGRQALTVDTQARDKAELQRQIDDVKKMLDAAVTRREVEELRERVKALENRPR